MEEEKRGDVFKIGQRLKVAKKVNSVEIMTTQKTPSVYEKRGDSVQIIIHKTGNGCDTV